MKSIHLAQAQYLNLPTAHQTATSLLIAKCRMMGALLKRAWSYRQHAYPGQKAALAHAIFEQQKILTIMKNVRTPHDLFLAEARATKSYWSGFRFLVRAPMDWKRIHPGGSDPWNEALNIGYTLLGSKIRAIVIREGLDPEIGILHASQRGKDALVYDLMELFRQSIVDAAVIRLFARVTDPSAQDPHQVIRECSIRYAAPCFYLGHRVTREQILGREVHRFKQTIMQGHAFQPALIRV